MFMFAARGAGEGNFNATDGLVPLENAHITWLPRFPRAITSYGDKGVKGKSKPPDTHSNCKSSGRWLVLAKSRSVLSRRTRIWIRRLALAS